MKIKYLGTAAAEGLPSPFCACEICKTARRRGGRNLRTRSQALIDNTLLLDLCPDTFSHAITYHIDLTSIRHCLITHVHPDHFYPNELANTIEGYAHLPTGAEPFCLYGSEDVMAVGQEQIAMTAGKTTFEKLNLFEPTVVCGYEITPLRALHGTDHPYIYLISKNGKNVLYGHDTGIFPSDTWDYLQRSQLQLQFVSLDCTGACDEDLSYDTHMCLGRNRICAERLREIGVADQKTKFCINHFSHNGSLALYEELCEAAASDGFLVSYDGMEIEF